jgi:hypothetical protein
MWSTVHPFYEAITSVSTMENDYDNIDFHDTLKPTQKDKENDGYKHKKRIEKANEHKVNRKDKGRERETPKDKQRKSRS